MLASTKRSNVRSTISSSRGSVQKKNETFMGYIIRKCREIWGGFWGFSRRFLWISTTGS